MRWVIQRSQQSRGPESNHNTVVYSGDIVLKIKVSITVKQTQRYSREISVTSTNCPPFWSSTIQLSHAFKCKTRNEGRRVLGADNLTYVARLGGRGQRGPAANHNVHTVTLKGKFTDDATGLGRKQLGTTPFSSEEIRLDRS